MKKSRTTSDSENRVRLRLYGNAPRCWWCGKKLADHSREVPVELSGKSYAVAVCSEEHRRATERAYDYINKVFLLFPVGFALGIFLIVAEDLVGWGRWSAFSGLAVCGATLLVCPFTTPQTMKMLGLKTSLRIGRIAGGLLLAGAVVMMVVFD